MTNTAKARSLLYFAIAFVASPLTRAVMAEPAVVNLAGEWRFALDRSAEQQEDGAGTPTLTPGDGVTQEWFKRDLPDKIKLPGILQAQGYGDDISTNTPWVLTLGDAWWKLQPASLRDHFSQPGHVEVPFLSQPAKHYLGAAWYQRDIQIPADWQGRHFTLVPGTRPLANDRLGGRQILSPQRQPRGPAHHRSRHAQPGQTPPDHPC